MLIYIHALSPLHVGIGHSPSAIDLPIARDKATGFPIIPGSGLKGALRAAAGAAKREVIRVFGPETTNASEHAGGVHFGDAQLVALPVRSIAGTFAWVTSPYLLRRLKRDLEAAGVTGAPPIPSISETKRAKITDPSALRAGAQVVLEDLDFDPSPDPQAQAWADLIANAALAADWRAFFVARFLVVHDDMMRYLSVHAIDVTSRNRLDNDTKTVADGALWTEENLPTETILVSYAHLAPNAGTLDEPGLRAELDKLSGQTIQLGGNATVGRGRCALRIGGTR